MNRFSLPEARHAETVKRNLRNLTTAALTISDHVSLAVAGAGAALNYLIARFAGQPAPNTCQAGGVTVASTLLQPVNNLVIELTALAGLTGFF